MEKLDSLKNLLESVRSKQGLGDGYIHHLVRNPERVDSIIMWLICTLVVWFVIWKFRERIISGMSGKNTFFESGEVVTFITLWCYPPILFHVGFFKEVSTYEFYALLFIGGILGYALMGRYLFDWALAFKTGSNHVNLTDSTVQQTTTISQQTTTTEQPKS